MSDRESLVGTIQEGLVRHLDEELVREGDAVLSTVQVDRRAAERAWKKVAVILMRTSPVKQFGIGFGIGWMSGYLFRKVSRTAAFFVGCTFLAAQGAYALGLINVDWMEIKRAARQNMKKVENRFSHMVGTDGTTTRSFVEKTVDFCNRNMYATSGFISGAVVAITF